MKKLLTISALFFLISCNDAPKQTVATTEAVKPEATTISSSYAVDTAASSLQWEGYEGLSLGDAEHAGSLKISKGMIHADSSVISGGEFTFNMNSIAITDIPAASPKNEKLKKH